MVAFSDPSMPMSVALRRSDYRLAGLLGAVALAAGAGAFVYFSDSKGQDNSTAHGPSAVARSSGTQALVSASQAAAAQASATQVSPSASAGEAVKAMEDRLSRRDTTAGTASARADQAGAHDTSAGSDAVSAAASAAAAQAPDSALTRAAPAPVAKGNPARVGRAAPRAQAAPHGREGQRVTSLRADIARYNAERGGHGANDANMRSASDSPWVNDPQSMDSVYRSN